MLKQYLYRATTAVAGVAILALASGCRPTSGDGAPMAKVQSLEIAQSIAVVPDGLPLQVDVANAGGEVMVGDKKVGRRGEVVVPVRDGMNEIPVKADGKVIAVLKIDADPNPPELVITDPTDKYRTAEDQVMVTGYARDRNLGVVEVNRVMAEVDEEGNWKVPVKLLPGTNWVRARAYDTAGNVSEFEIRVKQGEGGGHH